MNVAICIITCRQVGLRRLLAGIDALQMPERTSSIEIIVVDNDAKGEVCQLCDAISVRWPMRCVVESRQGIPYARNRAFQEAKHADFIAFIDDDEVPHPPWLNELLRVQQQYDADLVVGPVIPRLPPSGPSWLIKGGFFERPRFSTGTVRPNAATNNLLIRTAILSADPAPFDERMRFTGGTDTRLTRQLVQQGYSIIWADEAVVDEWIPRKRLQPRWILQRAYRSGNGVALIEMLEGGAVSTRIARALKGIVHFLLGLMHTLLRGLFSKRALLHGVHKMCLGAGMITGALHWWYEEYKRQPS